MCYRSIHVSYACRCETVTEEQNEFCIFGDLCAKLDHHAKISQESKHMCPICRQHQDTQAGEKDQKKVEDDDDDGFTVVKKKKKKKTAKQTTSKASPQHEPTPRHFTAQGRAELDKAARANLEALLRTRPLQGKRNNDLFGYIMSLPPAVDRDGLIGIWVWWAVGRELVGRLQQAFEMAQRRGHGAVYQAAWLKAQKELIDEKGGADK